MERWERGQRNDIRAIWRWTQRLAVLEVVCTQQTQTTLSPELVSFIYFLPSIRWNFHIESREQRWYQQWLSAFYSNGKQRFELFNMSTMFYLDSFSALEWCLFTILARHKQANIRSTTRFPSSWLNFEIGSFSSSCTIFLHNDVFVLQIKSESKWIPARPCWLARWCWRGLARSVATRFAANIPDSTSAKSFDSSIVASPSSSPRSSTWTCAHHAATRYALSVREPFPCRSTSHLPRLRLH